MFQLLIGMEYEDDGICFIHQFSPHKFTCCFILKPSITYNISQPEHFHQLHYGIPCNNSHVFLQSLHGILHEICDIHIDLFNPTSHLSPLSRAIDTQLKDDIPWNTMLTSDSLTCLMMDMVYNPSLINKETLHIIHHVSHHPIWSSNIKLIDNIPYLHKILSGSESIVLLCIVPDTMHNITPFIFVQTQLVDT